MNPISLQLCFCFIVFITILKLACTRGLSSQKVGFSVSSMSMSSAVRITSYNVLSTNLGGPDYYKACNPKWLDSAYRMGKLKQKLDVEVAKDAIICLQEVSLTCAGVLHSYFASKGYHFVTGLYGNKFNGYMGVGVAVPLDKYSIEGVDITRVADTKKMIRKPQDYSVIKLARRFLLDPLLGLIRSLGLFRPAFKPFDDAMKRMNQMVTLKVTPKNKPADQSSSFVVGTYHMPCMFQYPAVMMIHCALSAQHIQRYAGGLPYVFTGDFNIKPKDPMYRLLTQGTIDVEEPARPINEPGDQWSPLVQPMRSAYVEKNGNEPPFTNWAKVKDDPPFIDTLDYLFLSPEWRVAAVEPLPEVQGPFPTESEPSDHLLISATLEL